MDVERSFMESQESSDTMMALISGSVQAPPVTTEERSRNSRVTVVGPMMALILRDRYVNVSGAQRLVPDGLRGVQALHCPLRHEHVP